MIQVAAYTAAVRADSPVGYWRLREASGTVAADASGNGHAGTYVGAPTLGVAGPIVTDAADNAISLNGTSQRVAVGSIATPRTLEAWVKLPANTGTLPVFSNRAAGSSSFVFFGLAGGKAFSYVNTRNPAPLTGTIRVDDGAWHQIAYTWDGTTGKLYVDGALDVSAAQSDGTAAYNGAASIGYDVPNNSYFPGSVDDVSVYSTTLTASQLIDHFHAAVPPASAPANTSLPTIAGTAQAALTLTASPGSWSGPAWTYAYQWRRCDSSGNTCADIAGATAQSYVLAPVDVGSTIRVTVTASNSLGNSSATSVQTAAVIANNPPAVTTTPAITGTAVDGWTLSVSNGTWTNSPTSFSYQWRRCGSSGSPCYDITGATGSTYTSTVDDDDRMLKAVVTAVNSGGAGTATVASSVIAGRTEVEPPPLGFGATMAVRSARSLARKASCPSQWYASNGRYIQAYQWLCSGTLDFIPRDQGYGFETDMIKECLASPNWPWNTCRDNSTSCNGINGHCLDVASEIWRDFGPGGQRSPGPLVDYYANPANCDAEVPQTRCKKRVLVPGEMLAGQAGGGCGSALYARNTTECDGDPVNSYTGGFRYAARDLTLTGVGPAVTIARSYSSENPGRRPFGPGWAFSFGASLYLFPSGNVRLDGEDGQTVYYYRQGDGSFVGAAGATATLAAVSGGYELTRADQLVYGFNGQGRLVSLRDRNGRQTTLSYDANGYLTGITDALGRTAVVTSTPDGLISGVTLPDGRGVSYQHTGGRLTSVTDVRGGTTSYVYNAGGRIASVVDANGHTVVQNTYDADGRVTAQTDANNKQTTFSWSDATHTLTATDARGNVWKDVYDHGKLVQRIDPLNNTTSYGYDASFNRTSITDPRGNTTTATYDARGNVLTVTAPSPLSYVQSMAYNARNDVTSFTDGRNNATSYSYDTAGNLTGITRPGGATIQFGHDASGSLVTSVTNARSKTTTLGYDTSGRPTTITSPLGSAMTLGYDGAGRVTSIVDPRGNVNGATPDDYKTAYTYNAAGQVVTATDPLGHQSSWTYDSVGNLTSRTDANNHTTSYAYNPANHVTSVTAPGGAVTSYTYDNIGNVLSKTDPNNHVTTYAYDAANRLITVTTPLSRVWTFGYDANGNVTSVVDANGNATQTVGDGTTTYAYDVLNRLASITYSDGTPSVGYTYDAAGNRTEMSDGAGTQTSTFDSRNRLAQVARGLDVFGYAYDADGNVTQRTFPGGRQADYAYTDDGQLATVASGGTTTSYSYDPAGELVRTDLPATNGYVETRAYNRAGLLTEVRNANATATLSLADYVYDAVGNPTSITTTDGTSTLSYDNRDRLIEVCYQASCPGANDPFIRYAYDAVGNRTSESRPTGTTSYGYDAADQLTTAGALSYAFDADGNQTQAGAKTYAYDLAGRLTSASDGTTTVTYSYDGNGNRLLASTGDAANQKTKYLWDVNNPLPQLALERDGNNALLRNYLYGESPVSMDAGAATHYFHRDGLGSIVNLTSSTGTVEWSYSYEPYGSAKTATQNDPSAPANPIRFVGEYLDPASGLVNLRARQYDTGTGRFLSRDPLARTAFAPAVSSYIYADNRPEFFVDPSGMGSVWNNAGRGCTGFVGNFQCVGKWVRDPNNLWDPVRGGAAFSACVEGARVGRVAGPYGSLIGCLTVAVAFDLSAERAKERVTEP